MSRPRTHVILLSMKKHVDRRPAAPKAPNADVRIRELDSSDLDRVAGGKKGIFETDDRHEQPE